jgi:hypothetical protein
MRKLWIDFALIALVGCASDEAGGAGGATSSDSGPSSTVAGSGGSNESAGSGVGSSGAAGIETSVDASAGGSITPPVDAALTGGDAKPDVQASDPPGIFVAVGYGARTVRSTDDGATWIDDKSLVPQGGDDKYLLRTVVWGNHEFVALGWRVMKSPDGSAWDDKGEIIGQWIGSAVYVKSGYVAIGGYGLRVTSADALTFQHHDIDTIASHAHDGLVFGDDHGGRFVAANDDGKRTFSTDGKTWMAGTGAATIKTSEVAFGNGVFLGVGGRDVVVSKDGGATWTTGGQLPQAGQGLVFAQGHFTALANGHVFTSVDGSTWDDHAVKGITGGGLAYGHGTYVSVQGTTRRRSKDGLAWDPPVMGGTNALEWVTFGPSQ